MRACPVSPYGSAAVYLALGLPLEFRRSCAKRENKQAGVLRARSSPCRRMPEPTAAAAAAPGWGLNTFTGLFESGVFNVFGSTAAGGGEGKGGGGGEAAAITHVPLRSGQQQRQQKPSSPTKGGSADTVTRLASGENSESDLPELEPLHRSKTPVTSVPTSDEEPPGRRGAEVSALVKNPNNMFSAAGEKQQTNEVHQNDTIFNTKKEMRNFP